MSERMPVTARERELLAPDIQELTQAAVAFQKARDRLGRMARALRADGAQLDPTEMVWIVEPPADGETDAEA